MVNKNKDVLTTGQLRRLLEHQYKAEGSSLLEPVMQKFWQWLVEQVPRWWAPNAITAIGLAINVFTTLIMVYYSPDAKRQVRNYYKNIICLFIIKYLQRKKWGGSSLVALCYVVLKFWYTTFRNKKILILLAVVNTIIFQNFQ